jgi:hypothetical protein
MTKFLVGAFLSRQMISSVEKVCSKFGMKTGTSSDSKTEQRRLPIGANGIGKRTAGILKSSSPRLVTSKDHAVKIL